MKPLLFDSTKALLMVIDIQERLTPSIDEHERVVQRTNILIRAARVLGMPIMLTEQYKKGLGPTIPIIDAALHDDAQPTAKLLGPYEKLAFGCLGDDAIAQALSCSGKQHLLLCGIETHVCVLQTALKALADGYVVFLAEDALGSRRASDRETALRRMIQAGAIPATVEMLVMEALFEAKGDSFKQILPLLKDI